MSRYSGCWCGVPGDHKGTPCPKRPRRHEDRLWRDLTGYQPGDIVTMEVPVRRTFIEWLLRRPRRVELREYVCQSARNDRWRPVSKVAPEGS